MSIKQGKARDEELLPLTDTSPYDRCVSSLSIQYAVGKSTPESSLSIRDLFDHDNDHAAWHPSMLLTRKRPIMFVYSKAPLLDLMDIRKCSCLGSGSDLEVSERAVEPSVRRQPPTTSPGT